MRILLATPWGGVSGGMSKWSEHIIEYYNALNNKSIAVDLLPMGRSILVNHDKLLFFHRLFFALKDYSLILRTFSNMISEKHYDIMHLTSSASISLLKDILMIKKAKNKGIKCIIHFHFGRIPQLSQVKNWEWSLLNHVVKMADKVIVLDKRSYDVLTERGYSNIELLPNPVTPTLKAIINNNSVKRIPRSILFVGHVVKNKGVFELVEACKQIPNIQLKMVGQVFPEVKKILEDSVNHVSWLHIEGEKNYVDVIKEMLACDLFVLPTYTEGFPNVILESMACGCAIITTKVGAIPEMLEEDNAGKYGIMIDYKNIEQLRNAIERLLLDVNLKNECGINAKRRVNEKYDISQIWEYLINIWKNTMC